MSITPALRSPAFTPTLAPRFLASARFLILSDFPRLPGLLCDQPSSTLEGRSHPSFGYHRYHAAPQTIYLGAGQLVSLSGLTSPPLTDIHIAHSSFSLRDSILSSALLDNHLNNHPSLHARLTRRLVQIQSSPTSSSHDHTSPGRSTSQPKHVSAVFSSTTRNITKYKWCNFPQLAPRNCSGLRSSPPPEQSCPLACCLVDTTSLFTTSTLGLLHHTQDELSLTSRSV